MSELSWLLSEDPTELVHVLPLLSLTQLDWLMSRVDVIPSGEVSAENDLRKVIVSERMSRISKVA